jgi:hypothetical protein
MKHSKIIATALLASSLTFFTPANAQVAGVNLTAIETACATSADACVLAISAARTALGAAALTPAARNQVLGQIFGAAVTGSASLPSAVRAQIAPELREVLLLSTDTQQGNAMVTVANAIANQNPLDTDAFASVQFGSPS